MLTKEINTVKEIEYAEQLLAWSLEMVKDLGVEVRFFGERPEVRHSADGGGFNIMGTSFAHPSGKSFKNFDEFDKAMIEMSSMGVKHAVGMIEKELGFDKSD